MSLARKKRRSRWLDRAMLIVIFLFVAACSSGSSLRGSPAAPVVRYGSLPGQQIWNEGVSSFIFGTNDTQEWHENNIQTSPAMQQALKDANFTLMRTFFFDKSLADDQHPITDAEVELRLKTVENSGMTCLGVLFNVFNTDYNKHIVTYAKNRCLLYEFGNEADYNGVSIEEYLKQWNTVIPMLRKLNPRAKFIGPVTYKPDGNRDFMQKFLEGVKVSGVLPDAISFHLYPCWEDKRDDCLAKATQFYDATQEVRTLVKSILGKELPIGITEWNYDPGNPPPEYGDDPDFMTKFTTSALQSMIRAGVAFANQFDAASYGGYGRLDMFDVETSKPKPQYYAIKELIKLYRPSSESTTSSPVVSIGEKTGPLVSRGKPVICFRNDGPDGPQSIVNGRYGNWSYWHANQVDLPSWCAIRLDPGPKRLLVIWTSGFIFDYLNDNGSGPQDYSIAVSSDSTDGSDGTWQTVVNVTENHTRTREHLISFSGMAWVKMTVTKVQPRSSGQDFSIDEIDIYDVTADAALKDSFFFMGASITTSAFNRFDKHRPSLVDHIHTANPKRFPAFVNGGVGGWNSEDVVLYIDTLLALNPDMHYWLIGLGTNDAFGQRSPQEFRANLQVAIDKIKQAGHVPILSRIPYASVPGSDGIALDESIKTLNAAIDQLIVDNKLIPGPDFYQLYRDHAQEYLDTDGIHPSPTGAVAMNLAWFQALQPYIK